MTPSALRIEGLHFQWPGSAGFDLDSPSLELATGRSLFIYGPTGSGKSTLLNLIGGVLMPKNPILSLQ